MHFRHISNKIQLKNLKQHFDWGALGLYWLRPWYRMVYIEYKVHVEKT